MDYRLSVDRQHILEGLKRLKIGQRRLRTGDAATLGFDGSFLTIDVGDILVLAHAIGAWPGNAVVSVSLIHGLAAVPPTQDPIIVICDGKHLTFGPLKVACRWQPVSAALMQIPARREWHQAIALKYKMPRGRIIAEGLGPEVTAAERKLEALMKRTAKSLAPFGVTTDDLRQLVEQRLGERYADSFVILAGPDGTCQNETR